MGYQRKAYAKVNLSLDVTGRLDNGYHLVDMIMQTVNIYDELSFERTDGEIVLESDCGELPLDENNLIYKAIRLIQEECGVTGGLRVFLKKNIPIAAGMAGGSTDCAATLMAMDELYSLKLGTKRLMELGVKLGADVPYCILGGTARAQGIGEKLTRLPNCPTLKLLVAKPDLNVSTKEVYTGLDALENLPHPGVDDMVRAIESGNGRAVAAGLGNVLECVTIPLHPVIREIKDRMLELGAINSLMSGSGPTVFGIYEKDEELQKAYEALAESGLAKQIFMTEPVW